MDCFDAIFNRRSCRAFKSQPVEPDKVNRILEAALYAPSPANKQPWEFIVTGNPKYREQLKASSDLTKDKLAARSGWKWLPTFSLDFLVQAPLYIVVVGDPARGGAEQFLDTPSPGWLEACCAAIQNMQLAAQAEGLGSLWFSLYEPGDVRKIFGIDESKEPVAVLCIGYPDFIGNPPVRKGIADKVVFLD